jgi:hypothetical protein
MASFSHRDMGALPPETTWSPPCPQLIRPKNSTTTAPWGAGVSRGSAGKQTCRCPACVWLLTPSGSSVRIFRSRRRTRLSEGVVGPRLHTHDRGHQRRCTLLLSQGLEVLTWPDGEVSSRRWRRPKERPSEREPLSTERKQRLSEKRKLHTGLGSAPKPLTPRNSSAYTLRHGLRAWS